MVLLRRLRGAIDERLREEQAGFRSSRSCSEQIFCLHNIIEQCIEYRHPLCVNFIDFRKAVDNIHRESLWAILRMHGIPQAFGDVFRSLYLNSCRSVKTNTGHYGFFEITMGMRQGCILSLVLFNIALDFVMGKAMKPGEAGISWDNHGRLTDLDYADDVALLAESDSRLQEATSSLNQEATKMVLRISAEKSKVIKIGIEHTPININVGTIQLENITKFTYPGSTVSYDGDADTDIRTRIAKVAAVFRRLWATTSISNNIKLRLYLSIVGPTAIYASETWKISPRVIKKKNGFYVGCLRRSMKIRYIDHVINEKVVRRSNTTSLNMTIAQRRVRPHSTDAAAEHPSWCYVMDSSNRQTTQSPSQEHVATNFRQ
ncbi:hypothetical protein Y032_0018g3712 [Ancylostoma ceylanicum]|uniref:Reverse transcriptase domain-containing protein n=1 Tax=Ancylostoma ceylanicum TaxID=53326 RepID=A0A016V3V0_9BILA|nr:hypothetical protein Y032_0018g3712 [Ancylostoma ceylanicum]